MTRITIWLAIAVNTNGCGPGPRPPADAAAPGIPSITNDLDVLFVIDNSASTADKQAALATSYPAFAQALDAFALGRPNLHIGVVDTTTDIGVQGFGPGCPSPDPNDDGVLQNVPRVAGCSAPTDRYIADVTAADGSRTTNYTG